MKTCKIIYNLLPQNIPFSWDNNEVINIKIWNKYIFKYVIENITMSTHKDMLNKNKDIM